MRLLNINTLVTVLTVATVLTSCTKDKVAVTNKVSSIELTPNVLEPSGKNVNRNTIPLYVSSIEVETDMNGLTTSTDFDLVKDGGSEGFIINDVPLGTNTITATTAPAEDITLRRVFFSTGTKVMNWDVNEVLGRIAAELVENGYYWSNRYNVENIPPYAVYTGETTALLVDGEVADIKLDMDTNYGRSIYSIGVENTYDLANYNVDIRSKFYDAEGTEVYNHQVILDNGNSTVMGLWSDELSVEGAKIEVTFIWRADGSKDVVNTKSIIIPIKAKEDTYTKIVLNRSTFVVEETGLTFSFKPIENKNQEVILE